MINDHSMVVSEISQQILVTLVNTKKQLAASTDGPTYAS